MIQVFSNTLGADELMAISDVLRTRWVGKGAQCDSFEREFAEHLGVSSTLLTNNCTAAIYIGLRALGIGAGDEVIIPAINFVASASAVIDMGATPVFADVDLRTLNILPREIERLTTKRTKAVLLLHYGGNPCPMVDISSACKEGTLILEDSANAVNSSFQGKMCGTLGDAGFWSFDAMKILVMADGGALYLRDEEAYRKAHIYRYLGMSSKSSTGIDSFIEKRDRWWEYEIEATSGRFISNDILAAIGRVQLKKLSDFIARRKQIWDYYQGEFKNIPGLDCPPDIASNETSSYYLYWIQTAKSRDDLAAYLAGKNVYTTFRYYPLNLVKLYRQNNRLPNSEKISEITLNIPLHQNLSDDDVSYIVELIKAFYK